MGPRRVMMGVGLDTNRLLMTQKCILIKTLIMISAEPCAFLFSVTKHNDRFHHVSFIHRSHVPDTWFDMIQAFGDDVS